jgi:bifunctional non-homologous end joining protein LigD
VKNAPDPLKATLATLARERAIRPAMLNPASLSPQLAQLSQNVPAGASWIFEPKLDGYRILAVKRRERIALFSRAGQDWTYRFTEVARTLARLPLATFALDGEIVVLDARQRSSFSALQKKLSEEAKIGFTYFAFDFLYANGFDLRPLPLLLRKQLLSHVLSVFARERRPVIRDVPFTRGNGRTRYAQACSRALEGIIAKNGLAAYRGRRGSDWLKIKCRHEDEFVIGGFTDPAGSRQGFGSLLLGYFNTQRRLIYAGRVGTGFDDKILSDMRRRLAPLETARNPFAGALTGPERRGAHYVRPQLVAQLAYTEWTEDGRLRHPVFLGLREDKPAREVTQPI